MGPWSQPFLIRSSTWLGFDIKEARGLAGELRTLNCRILSPISVLAPRLVDGG